MSHKLHAMVVLGCALSVVCIAGHSPAIAGDTDRLAQTIAPYLDEQTILIAHLHLDQIDLDAIVASAEKMMPLPEPLVAEIKQQMGPAQGMLDTFIKAGGREVFAVCSLADMPNVPKDPPIFFVVPIVPGGDPNALLNLIQQTLDGSLQTATRLPEEGPIVIGAKPIVDRLRSNQAVPRKHLDAAFAAVDGSTGRILFLPNDDHRRVVREMFPKLPEPLAAIDGPTLADGLLWAGLGINIQPELRAQIVFGAKDPRAAQRMAVAWQQLVDAGGQAVIQQLKAESQYSSELESVLDSVKESLQPRIEMDQLLFSLTEESIRPIVQRVFMPAVTKSTQAAHRMQRVNQFKQIALAMHNWHDKNKHFPPAAIRGADGKPLLSWRVAILPYLDEQELYDQFHLDEPWDSEHNRPLVDKMPAIYKDAEIASWKDKDGLPAGYTTYVVPIGDGFVFGNEEGTPLKEIKDGSSQTILIVAVKPDHAVPWTQPADWQVDPKSPLAGIQRTDRDDFVVGFCDGSVRTLENNIAPERFWNMLTRAGGEVIDN